MKKFYWLFIFFVNHNNGYAQNVGIGINTPLAPLHIKKNLEALRIEGSSSFISFYNNAGTLPRAFLQHTNDNLYLGTSTGNINGLLQFYLNQSPIMTMRPTGETGIGTALPIGRLHILHPGPTAHIIAEHPEADQYSRLLFTNTGVNRYWGIAARAGHGPIANDRFSIYNLSTGFESLVISGNGNVALPGNIGVGTGTTQNKMQIGSVGATGYNGNDLAIGNGNQAMVIYQSNVSTLIGSSTDIVLRPRNNGQGRVGVNTTTPRAPLDVEDAVGATALAGFYSYLNFASFTNGIGSSTNTPVPNVSIMCSGRIYATEFDAYSDIRIKNITGTSNASSDLAAIAALQIRNYTMKDKVRYGNKSYKKVIAQEVEKIYPQVVSLHTDFIPNVYQSTGSIHKTDNGYLLRFDQPHAISSNAKKLRILVSPAEGMQQFEILSIPSGQEVVINATNITPERVFVYGEEVDDFRTVDYEGLTTLHISATQEITRRMVSQQAIIARQQKQISVLEKRLIRLEQKISGTLGGLQ